MAEIAAQRKALGIVSAVAITAKPSSSLKPADTAAETESDAEIATMPRAETDAALADANAGAPFDEDGPDWPSAADEAAFISGETSEARAVPKAGVQTLRQAADEAETALGPLPALDVLIARIPAEARETLEDLFRPKFTGVRRVSPDVLK
jgi:hypothetical protein